MVEEMSWTKLNVVTPRSFHLTACQRAGMKCSSSMETPLGEGLRPKLRSPDARGDFQSPAEASPALGLRAGAGQSSEGWPWLGGTCELRWCLGGCLGGVCVCVGVMGTLPLRWESPSYREGWGSLSVCRSRERAGGAR